MIICTFKQKKLILIKFGHLYEHTKKLHDNVAAKQRKRETTDKTF